MIVHRRVGRSQRRRETTVEHRIDKLSSLRKEQSANVIERETGLLHCVGYSHSLEIATVVNISCGWIDERVIRG